MEEFRDQQNNSYKLDNEIKNQLEQMMNSHKNGTGAMLVDK